uniref:LRAT domain-containing protein n=1 Tax=viral metagenome TaxID=1070528 RepID=A0A6C0KXD6_9ZZZZ
MAAVSRSESGRANDLGSRAAQDLGVTMLQSLRRGYLQGAEMAAKAVLDQAKSNFTSPPSKRNFEEIITSTGFTVGDIIPGQDISSLYKKIYQEESPLYTARRRSELENYMGAVETDYRLLFSLSYLYLWKAIKETAGKEVDDVIQTLASYKQVYEDALSKLNELERSVSELEAQIQSISRDELVGLIDDIHSTIDAIGEPDEDLREFIEGQNKRLAELKEELRSKNASKAEMEALLNEFQNKTQEQQFILSKKPKTLGGSDIIESCAHAIQYATKLGPAVFATFGDLAQHIPVGTQLARTLVQPTSVAAGSLHHGIYIGHNLVVEVTNYVEGGKIISSIAFSHINTFLQRSLDNYSTVLAVLYRKPQDGSVTVQRCLDNLGRYDGYNLLNENCESFATWVMTGRFATPGCVIYPKTVVPWTVEMAVLRKRLQGGRRSTRRLRRTRRMTRRR